MDPPRYRASFTKACTVCTKPELSFVIVLVAAVVVAAIVSAIFMRESLGRLYLRVRYNFLPIKREPNRSQMCQTETAALYLKSTDHPPHCRS